jgi:DNA helicase MCM9
VEGSHVCRDFQELKVQEQVQKLSMGSIPRSILVIMQDDLVDLCKAGDDVTLTGVVRHMWQPLARDQRCELEVFIDTNSVLVSNDKKGAVVITRELREDFEGYWRAAAAHPLRARDLIVRSVCPQLYGLYLVKLCVALTLIGGVQRIEASGMRVRGESHLLIVGDPGTGKSQLLRYAARISPRSVLTTGIGTTSAGLTVTAVKDNGEWMLEAGALVLADGGLCCIDEFGCIRESDRATIHEAMEQQTLSVAKAGLVCSLNTRCTVFAVLNPKGPYDHKAELSVNTAIASPLLSRFDVVLLMLDTQNEAWDEKVASYILDNASGGGGSGSAVAASAAAAAADGDGDVDGDGGGGGDPSQRPAGVESKAAEAEAEVWPLERMQAYVQLVKSEFRPVMLPFSKRILISYYQIQRQKCERSAARTTIRLLESLVRLAQAHARLMFRPVVLPVDAITAVIAVESSTLVSSILGVSSALHAGFAEDPDALFAEQQEIVLQRLGLSSRDIPPDERSYNYAALCRLAAGTPSAWPRGSSVGPGAPASDSTRSEPSLGALADGALGLDGLPCRSTPERFAPQPLSEAPAFASPSSEQPLRRAAAASAAPRSSSPLHAGAAIGSGALAASLGTVARRQRGGLELWDSELSHALGSEQVLDSSLHAPSPKRRR